MSGTIALLLLIPLLVALAAAALLRANLLSRLNRPPSTPPDASTGTTIRAAARPPLDVRASIGQLQSDRQVRVGAVALVGLAIFAVVLLRVTAPPSQDDFVVLVAPFQEQDGTFTQTGRSAAEQLVALLPQATGGRVRAALAEQSPADDQAARRMLAERGADVLVWGTIAPGGLLDAETLTPLLAYQPTGAYAPNAWEGYAARFALPLTYRVADRPLNGAVVLPGLLAAVADYGADRPDSAATLLTRLDADYPALAPTLPHMLLGNLLWARGENAGAAEAYRRALAAADTTGRLPQAALLYNNLGAVLQDAGDLSARDAFNQAITLLNAGGSDLGELRYNLARASLATGDAAGALTSLEQARRLLAANTPLLLDLAEAYRVSGQLSDSGEPSTDGDAQSLLGRIERQITRDIDAAPPDLRQLESDRLRARYARSEALQSLTDLVDLRGPLLWGLEARRDLNAQALGSIRATLDTALRLEQNRTRGWSTRSAAQDAAGHQIAGQIAAYQARLAEHDLREIQRWSAAVETELGETQNRQPPQGLAAVWSGLMRESTPLGESKRTLEDLAELAPRDADLLVLLGHNLLARGELEQATARFNAADTLSPRRPEPPYGLALVRLADQQAAEAQRRTDARSLLSAALERDPAFYPARIQLADLAEQEGDWATALTHRRQLAAEQPGDATLLALARTLRASGPAGLAEAEALLLPVANRNNISALLALAEIYRDYGDQAAQRVVLERAQRAAPRNVEVAYNLGLLSLVSGDRSEAERQFQIALAEDRAHIPSLLGMADLSAGRPEVAADFYQRALDAGENNLATLKAIGLNMLDAGQNELAYTAFERAIAINADDAEVQRGLARASLRLGRLEQAGQAAQRALDLRGGNYAEALLDLGDLARERGQLDEARDRYSAALRIDPALVEAHLGLGQTYAAHGDWAVAAGHFRSAVSANSSSVEARVWLGDSLIRQADAAGALEQYQAALALRPAYPEALFGAAQAQAGLGQFGEAEANLEAALKARPRYAEALLLQGKLYEQTNRERRALQSYEAAIDADRDLPEPHYRRALLLIQMNRLGDARGDLEAALRAQPIFPEANYWLGRIDFAAGRYREALDRFRSAVEQASGGYAEARYYQGLAEEQLGLRDDAIASFRATLDQSGNGAWSAEARAALSRMGSQ